MSHFNKEEAILKYNSVDLLTKFNQASGFNIGPGVEKSRQMDSEQFK